MRRPPPVLSRVVPKVAGEATGLGRTSSNSRLSLFRAIFVLQIYQTAGVSPSETPNQTREPREQTSFSPKITSLVSGNRLVPAPPPMTMASVLSWRDVLSIVNKEV